MFGNTTGEMMLEEKTAVSHRAGLPRSSLRACSATARPTPTVGPRDWIVGARTGAALA